MGAYNQNNKSRQTAFVGFIKKYGIIIVGCIFSLIVLIPMIKRYIENQKLKNYTNQLENQAEKEIVENNQASVDIIRTKTKTLKRKYPNASDKTLNAISTSAQRLARALGTNVQDHHALGYVDLYNVNAWTEDEKTAVSIVKKHSGTFPILADFYQNVHTKKRNLKDDLYKYLSNSNLEEIRKAHLKYGNYKHI